MKSISVQYQELKEGRMTQHQFLRNARMLFPNFVTNHNSFDDSVKILKSKGLLNEGNAVKGTPDKAPSYDYPTQPAKYKKVVQEPEVDEQDGIYPATTLTDIPKEEVSKPIKSKNRPDGLEPAKDKDKKNEMKKIRIVKESKRSLTELTSVSDKEIQSSEFNSLKNIQKDYLSNHPLSIQPTSFSGNKESPLKLTDIRWYNNQDGTFGFDMAFERPGNRDEYIAITFYKDNKNNPVKKISVTDRIQGSWKEYKDDIVGYLNKAMRSAQVDSRYVDSVITALSRMTPEKIRDTNAFNESNIKENTLSNTPDEQTFLRRLEQASQLKQALELVNMVGELDGIFKGILDSTKLDNVQKQQIIAAVKKAVDADPDDKGSNFTSNAVEKKKPSQPINPIDAARIARSSPGASGPGESSNKFIPEQSSNKLRETIKKMVNELLDEMGPAGMEAAGDPEAEREMRSALIVRRNSDDYDDYEGDLDAPPSGREAVSIIMDNFMDYISTNDIENPRLSDLDNVFSMFEDSVGKRYNDAVWSEVIYKLREKGYNLN
jgi:hypothetical protein